MPSYACVSRSLPVDRFACGAGGGCDAGSLADDVSSDAASTDAGEDAASLADSSADAGGSVLALLAGQLGGSGNVNGTGAEARFGLPVAVVYDGAGLLYISDQGSHTIRRLNTVTLEVTTFAGAVDIPGNADGAGAAARFTRPAGLALDGAGNLYVADRDNNAIRKIVLATAQVTTLAGGTFGFADGIGLGASFRSPSGVAWDAGTLYIADTGGQTIRALNLATARVSTLCGVPTGRGSTDGACTAARFSDPRAVAVVGAGELIVADSGNHTLRRVLVAAGEVTTLAGMAGGQAYVEGIGAAARFLSPVGLSLDGAGSLYVADQGNHAVRKVVLATAAVTNVVGGRQGSVDGIGGLLREPTGLAFGRSGDLYVADTDNFTIRRIVLSSVEVSTLAGTPPALGAADGMGSSARFNDPFALATDTTGLLYVTDRSNSRIRKVAATTGEVRTLADAQGTAFTFDGPSAIATDLAGDVYVTEIYQHDIRKIALTTAQVSTLAGTRGQRGSADGIGTVAGFSGPRALASDGASGLYVADTDNHTIRRVDLETAAVSTVAGVAGQLGAFDGPVAAARFQYPSSLIVDGAGDLYVADTNNHIIRKIDLEDGQVSTVAGFAGVSGDVDGVGSEARFSLPAGLTMDTSGNLYVADTGNSTVRRIVLATGDVSTFAGVARRAEVQLGPLPASLNKLNGLMWLPSGVLVLAVSPENALLIIR